MKLALLYAVSSAAFQNAANAMPALIKGAGFDYDYVEIDGVDNTKLAGVTESDYAGCVVVTENLTTITGLKTFLNAAHAWPVLVVAMDGGLADSAPLITGMQSAVTYGGRQIRTTRINCLGGNTLINFQFTHATKGTSSGPDVSYIEFDEISTDYALTRRYIVWRKQSTGGGINYFYNNGVSDLYAYSILFYAARLGIAVPHPVQFWLDIDNPMLYDHELPHCYRELGAELEERGEQVVLGWACEDTVDDDALAAINEYPDAFPLGLHEHSHTASIYISTSDTNTILNGPNGLYARAEAATAQAGRTVHPVLGGYVIAPGNSWSVHGMRALASVGMRSTRNRVSAGMLSAVPMGLISQAGFDGDDYWSVSLIPSPGATGEYDTAVGSEWLSLYDTAARSDSEIMSYATAFSGVFPVQTNQLAAMVHVINRYWHGPQCVKVNAGYVGLISQPSDGDHLSVAGIVFEFDSNADVVIGNVPVVIGANVGESRDNLIVEIMANLSDALTATPLAQDTGAAIKLVPVVSGTEIEVMVTNMHAMRTRLSGDTVRVRSLLLDHLKETIFPLVDLCGPNVQIAGVDAREKWAAKR